MSLKKFFESFIHIAILKTIWANFRYLPIKQAIYLPILLHTKSSVRILSRGKIKWDCPIKFGTIRIGSRSANIVDYTSAHTSLYIAGTLKVKGNVWLGSGCQMYAVKTGVLFNSLIISIFANHF